MTRTIHIGGASGYWGESDMAWAQLLSHQPLDYLVFDYLAEITMSLLARMRERDPAAGYATDFVSQLAEHLPRVAATGVRVISNAGGVNPESCARAVREAVLRAGLSLKVAVVTGDDLMGRLDGLSGATEMFTGEALPQAERIVSANAYLGAFPIAAALDAGADIVITGRVVDSAVTLGALIHEFGWRADELDRLAQGSLVGHLIECGPQVTGGNFTDWQDVAQDIADIGYPVASVSADGSAVISKPADTGGQVSYGTVAEQMLYEIGDPAEYILPDVVCDFTQVMLEEVGPDRVRVSGARGRGVPDTLKVSVTVADGHRISLLFFMVGHQADAKAEVVFDAVLERAERKLAAKGWDSFSQSELEFTGYDNSFGDFHDLGDVHNPRELAFRMSVRHARADACAVFAREALGFALAAPPGLSLYTGARARPQAVTRLFSTLVGRDGVTARVDGAGIPFAPGTAPSPFVHGAPPPPVGEPTQYLELQRLAWLRSGDKGDMSNIGIIARAPDYLPWIWAAVTEDAVWERFAHYLDGDSVRRWYLPGTHAINITMDRALGGGGMASLRNDPQGKGFAQILGCMPVPMPSVERDRPLGWGMHHPFP